MIYSHTCASSLAEKLIVCITRRQPPPTYCPCWTDNGGPLQLRMGLNSILNTQLFCLSLHSLAASVLFFLFLFVTFLHLQRTSYWNHTEKLTWICAPCGQTDETLWPLCAPRVPELQKTLTTRWDTAAANTTTCLDNTNPLSATKQQRLWLHPRTFLSRRLEHRLIKLIRTTCADQNRTLFGEIFHKWL